MRSTRCLPVDAAPTSRFSCTDMLAEDVRELRHVVRAEPRERGAACRPAISVLVRPRCAGSTVSRRAAQQPVDRLQQRRLAGAVRPDHGDEPALLRRSGTPRAGCSPRRSRRPGRAPRRGCASLMPAVSCASPCTPRYASITSGFRRTSSAGRVAITAPSLITWTRSLTAITTSRSCSISRKVIPCVAPQVLHVVEQLAAERRVDAGHRLVEQHHPRLRHQRARELEQLALAARERARVGSAGLSSGRARAARGPLRDLALRGAATRAGCTSAQQLLARLVGRGEHHVVEHGHPRQRLRACWNVRTSPAARDAVRPLAEIVAATVERRPSLAPGGRTRRSMLKSVVLPAPFGPIRAVIEPASTSSDASATAATPPKRLHASSHLEQRAHSSTISSRLPKRPCGRQAISAIRISADDDQPQVRELSRRRGR